MAASPNKAVSPKDYTVNIGRLTNKNALDPSTSEILTTRFDLSSYVRNINIPSYGIVGEYIFAYPQSLKNLTTNSDYYINCVYIFESLDIDGSLSKKCRYIRLVIIPNIAYTNKSTATINIIFNVEIKCGSISSESIELFRKSLPKNVTFSTNDKKYAVIYDLEKDEINVDTDDPIEEWSDSNQICLYP